MVPQSRSHRIGEKDAVLHHNPWVEPKGEPLVRLADEIFAETEADILRQSLRKPRKDATQRRRLALYNLVASLAELALRPNCESGIAVDARKTAKTRYDRRGFHRDVFMGAVTAMEQMGLLEVTPGQFRALRTVLKPTKTLRQRLTIAGVTPADIGVRPGGEPILLNTSAGSRGRKELVDYEDTPETARLRQEVQTIMETLNRADLRFLGETTPPVFMRRIFQIESRDAPQMFNRHGRLWGGWWQNLVKSDRGLITIDGEPICDLDFKACFLNIAYVRVGAPLPEGDAYEIEGLEATYRPALKKVLSTLFFRDGLKSPRLPDEIRRELPPSWTMGRLIEAFTHRHPAIAPLFGSGVGLEIMHTESQILVAALLDLSRQRVPALGMHDGLAVARNRKETGLAAMRSASRSIIGVELPVIEKRVEGIPH